LYLPRGARAHAHARTVSRRLNHARQRAVGALRARDCAPAHGALAAWRELSGILRKERPMKKWPMIGWPRRRRKNTRTRRARPRANKNANRSSILCTAVENETLKPAGPAARPGAH